MAHAGPVSRMGDVLHVTTSDIPARFVKHQVRGARTLGGLARPLLDSIIRADDEAPHDL